MKLIDQRTPDGSRHFAHLPQATVWAALCEHVLLLPGAEMLQFTGDGGARASVDFHFRQHRFLIDAYDGLFRFFVCDPQCPDLILYQVGCHFERLLERTDAGEKLPRPHAREGVQPIAS